MHKVERGLLNTADDQYNPNRTFDSYISGNGENVVGKAFVNAQMNAKK